MGGEPVADPATDLRTGPSWPEPAPRAELDTYIPRTGMAVLHVVGEIDHVEARVVQIRLIELLRAPDAQVVVLDLSRVTFMGSHALTAVVQAQRVAAELGRTLRGITGDGNRAVMRPVRMTGLDWVIEWFPGLPEAISQSSR